MRMSPRLLVLPSLMLVLAAGQTETAGHGAAKGQSVEKVSFCDLLARPAAYSGRLVVITVHIQMFKERVSLSSPPCSKKAVWLLIESESGPGHPRTFPPIISPPKLRSSPSHCDFDGHL